ncbi:MAG: sensor histidine kinase [Bacteroidales bacterium]|nr:sensor histidine kinase [Bacteroidales bacterium]
MLKILLALSIVLQLIAAGIALKLFSVTKYALSWILITIGFLLMVILRCIELVPYVSDLKPDYFRELYIWMGVVTSVCFATGVYLIQQIFNYMKKVENERRKTEKRFLSAIIQTEEAERTRIAKDLHDGMGPLLSAVKMSVSTLEHLNTTDPQSITIIRNASETVDEAIRSLKDISDNLSPHVLANFGMIRALINYVQKVNQTGQLEIDFQTTLKSERFDENVEVVIYRVASELIHNTIQHSQATHAGISLNYVNNELLLEYQDNGIGFEADRTMKDKARDGAGLTNIRSRINSLKGELKIESKPGLGLRVFIRIKANKKI